MCCVKCSESEICHTNVLCVQVESPYCCRQLVDYTLYGIYELADDIAGGTKELITDTLSVGM
jgi:hypothetical protein